MAVIKKGKKSNRGITLVMVGMLILAFALVGQLFHLQILQGSEYAREAGASHFKKIPTYPERGKIEDVNGETLALTTYVYTIGITPDVVRSRLPADKRPDQKAIIDSFSKLLGVDREKVQHAFDQTGATYVPIVKEIPKETYDPFEKYLEENKIHGVAVDSTPKRYYPKGDVASQVIGFANLQEQNLGGVTGVEAYYDKVLAGTPGYTYGEVDHYFRGQLPYTTPTEVPPVPGNNIILNIDSNLQEEVQKIVRRYSEIFACTDGASAIVMDTRTGAVLAMAQEHSYNLNKPYTAVPDVEEGAEEFFRDLSLMRGVDPDEERKIILQQLQARLTQLLEAQKKQEPDAVVQGPPSPKKILQVTRQIEQVEKEQERSLARKGKPQKWSPFENEEDLDFLNSRIWQNRNVTFTYEPGSTMKSFTVGTALEENAFKMADTFSDAPIWIRGFGDYAIHCHIFPNNHGYETAEQALWNSCNPIMVQLAERVGIEKFYEYVHRLGFYDLTGIDLPAESFGLLHKNPTVVDLAPMSFGESNTITPISLATAYTALGNGGIMMKPQVAKYLTDKDGKIVREFAPTPIRQVYSAQTCRSVLDMLRGCFVAGKGIVSFANEPGYFACGKSGTSTKSTKGDDVQDYSVMSVASIFPTDEPRYVVLGIQFNPNTPKSACVQSMVRDIIRATGKIMNVPKRYTQADLALAIKPKEISYANGITLQSIADYLAIHDVEFELSPGMKYNDYFYTMYPQGTVKLNGYPVYYVSKDGKPPTESVEIPDFTGKTFEEAADLAHQKRINIRYIGNPLTGVVVKQSHPAQEDGVQQRIRKYEVIELTFGQLPGYNPPTFRMVTDPQPVDTTPLPVVTDPIWTTQVIYNPYGAVPEKNPYGG